MLVLLLLVAQALVSVERVDAVVNGVPILASDVELAEAARLVPRQEGEDDDAYRRAVVEALIDLELRWQDLTAAAIAERTPVDLDAAWTRAAARAGGEEALRARLRATGLDEAALRNLLRHAAVVEAYAASRFAPFSHPTEAEIAAAWRGRFVPQLRAEGKPVPDLAAVRDRVVAVLTEEKLLAEVDRWTADLAQRADIVRYLGPAPASPSSPRPSATPSATPST